jgi:hypothetical protein
VLEGAEKAIADGDEAFRKLVLELTDDESDRMERTSLIEDEQRRTEKFKKVREAYWFRRLINAEYFRDIKKIV